MSSEGTASGNNTGQGNGASESDGEEQDEPSSMAESDSLDLFREKWQRELKGSSKPEVKPEESVPNCTLANDPEETIEEKAKQLFLRGVQHEQDGKLYESIQFYRRAVQLVPDIECRLYEASKAKQSRETEPAPDDFEEGTEDTSDEAENVSVANEDSGGEDDSVDMMTRLQRWYSRSHRVCQPNLPTSGLHISALPMELILHILRWVISSELDMRSLDLCCSGISRGFYLASRDPEIWRLACIRVWGVNCGGLSNYASWRDMFIERPRLHHHGCYISKTTYIRHGENSFQDQFYRPWHLIEYFRYLRFFPEGIVLMLTTPDDPTTSLRELRTRHPRNSTVLKGHYRLHDDHVTLVLKRQEDKAPTVANNRSRSHRKREIPETPEQTFHLVSGFKQGDTVDGLIQTTVQQSGSSRSFKSSDHSGVDDTFDNDGHYSIYRIEPSLIRERSNNPWAYVYSANWGMEGIGESSAAVLATLDCESRLTIELEILQKGGA